MDDFTTHYKNVSTSRKLNFLAELLQKDSDLQQQFFQYTQGKSLDAIAGVDIDDVVDQIWDELEQIDTEKIMMDCHYDYYDDEGMGDDILEGIFFPYRDKAIEYIQKGNYIDALRILLAIYEISVEEETPEIEDDYYLFGDDIEGYIEMTVSRCIADFNEAIASKVMTTEMVESLIELYFQRYQVSDNYQIDHFYRFFTSIITQTEMAHNLLHKIEDLGLYSIKSARTMLYCAKMVKDDALYLKIANEFYQEDSNIALALLQKYSILNNENNFAKIAKELLEKENSRLYTLTIIENINKYAYQDIYIKALKLQVQNEQSLEHYQILREYLELEDRLAFIESLRSSYSPLFYIQLLSLEERYDKILAFAQTHDERYYIDEILQPIVAIYPDEVFDIIEKNVTKLVEERGRSNYARAAQLLTFIKPIASKNQELKTLVNRFYNHQPRLPALRDEFEKAKLL